MQISIARKPFGITVVIPTFNRKEIIQCALASVTTRHPSLVEIIVIDDGSDINSLPLLAPTNSSGVIIRSYRFERNRGPQASRNLGIRRARFSYIAFLDSDDEFTTDKIDSLLVVLHEKSPDVLFHKVNCMKRYSVMARVWHRYLQQVLPFTWMCAFYNPIITPALVVRRRCRLGLPTMRYCEDWFYLLRYIDASMLVLYLDRELSIVNRVSSTPGSLSKAIWKMRKGEFKARSVLLRQLSIFNIARYLVGSLAGIVRIASDIMRGRY
jgi:glycosyltransferase involved in cell wall biosynthesis